MAFGSMQDSGRQAPMSEINVVPLVDVMLVLLIIFIITAPLLTHSVKIDLPKAESNPNITQPEHVELAIRADGSLFWNGETVALEQLAPRFAAKVAQAPNTELHIRADKLAHYEHVARLMSIAAKAGLTKIGFITDPSEK
ncbi:MAG: biopolymer transporter ExbD [Nitrosomonas sp.]|jgi:biopolymer transport protein ExbD|uniref:Outer membrane transport energization protein ExbD n=1 Tax=Nitrosomonas oligotropha TaxID=42354 RepID=A0A2T5I1E6_9PROT|nr:biopolymer transporter ExbD [Nitrosomonas oligotropha]MBK7492768.1 biopolymer transporter ExbD [Nitrosomonas sp.]MBP9101832.1 biopolymer transporter ExbD [Nitrosomonas sp.]PTQ77588.1 outer membrane transport energization protein ExbD [Nitrosomonas oligotropha]